MSTDTRDDAPRLDWRKRRAIMRQLKAAGLPCKRRHFNKLARAMGYVNASSHPRGPLGYRPHEPVTASRGGSE